MSIVAKIDSEAALKKYAELKKIPLARVLFHAAKDVAQAAYKATPKSKRQDGRFYTFKDAKTGEQRYLPKRMMKEPKGKRKQRSAFSASFEADWRRHPLTVSRGWSRGSWIGIFRALDMKKKPTTGNSKMKGSDKVATLGTVQQASSEGKAEVTITDRIHFDGLKRGGSDRASQAIISAGLKNASSRIAKDWAREIRKISK